MADRLAGGRPLQGAARGLAGALLTATCVVSLLCLLFSPQWETNDDVGMSMVAHGYGIAAKGSPNLIFSNVLWGHLVRSIPSIGGVPGYSLATLGVLIVVGGATLFALARAGAGLVTASGVLLLLLVRPVLFPQFTLNAGLLMVAAIATWKLAARGGSIPVFAAGCALALGSYLVRDQEGILVLVVASPMLPWKFLAANRSAKVCVALLAMAIGSAAWADHRAYQGHDWQAFESLNAARAPYTDFGAVPLLKRRPDILRLHGYSSNDLDLVGRWFFVDPQIADPKKLNAMIDDLGPLPSAHHALGDAWLGIRALWNPRLLVTLLVALLFFACSPSWPVAASWLLCVAAVAMIGAMGRPAVLRVYEPLVGLLLIAPLVQGRIDGWQRRLAAGAVFAAASFTAYAVCTASQYHQGAALRVRQELTGFPHEPVVIWGGVFPFEEVYPVLGASAEAMSYRLYGLGAFTLAPFSVPYAEREVGDGMVELLQSKTGVPVIANHDRVEYLKVYCSERLHGHLVSISTQYFGRVRLDRFRCDSTL